jgi:hypothetical protein
MEELFGQRRLSMNWKDFKKLNNSQRNDLWPTLDEETQKKIRKQRKTAANRKNKDEIMKSLGLEKVKGVISGKTYWE